MCAYYFSNNYSIVLYELYQYQSLFLNDVDIDIPVEPHEAVAEVSRIGNV